MPGCKLPTALAAWRRVLYQPTPLRRSFGEPHRQTLLKCCSRNSTCLTAILSLAHDSREVNSVRKLFLSVLLLSSFASAREMGWIATSRQNYRLEPGRWQAAGNYGPGPLHMNIGVRANSGINLGLVRTEDWEHGRKSPMQCQAHGLVNSTFTCDFEAEEP